MSRQLLYLEDDLALANITHRALAKRGLLVTHVADLAQADNALAKTQFDCALLDLKIGSSTSFELLRSVKQKGIHPVVILTGYGTIRAAVQAIKLGAVDFLSKPCSIEEILSALSTTLPELSDSALNAPITAPSLRNTEWEAIQKAMDDNDGNVSAAARQLKLHRRTLQRKLQKRHTEPAI